MANECLNCILWATIMAAVIGPTQQVALPSDSYYTAGVVEFSASKLSNARDRLSDNLKDYLEIIGSAEAEPADIVVFPESTLNNADEMTFVPRPDDEVVPCDQDLDPAFGGSHEFLRAISCQARNSSKYVVINLTEKEVCVEGRDDPRPCASSGLNVYNTNVVFDRQGRVISRYRKVHLYGEPKNTTLVPEFGLFDTDFGVRFGHFVCFDILFYRPAQEMAAAMGVRDFIFTTMWFGQLPFLTGVQIQSAWSYGNDVNLLAAGASNPDTGTTGSGIFHGRSGPLVAVMNQRRAERRLYVARVPKYATPRVARSAPFAPIVDVGVEGRLSQADIFLKRDYLEHYISEVVDLSEANSPLQRQLCYNSTFCCDFELSWRREETKEPQAGLIEGPSYTYRLGAFDGWRNEDAAETNLIKNCAVFACVGDDIADCGKLFADDDVPRAKVVFERILIKARFPKTSQFLLMPNSLREDLLPVAVDDFSWVEEDFDSEKLVSFQLETPVDDLLAFAVYGNYYDDGGQRDAGGGAARNALMANLVVVVLLLSGLWNSYSIHSGLRLP